MSADVSHTFTPKGVDVKVLLLLHDGSYLQLSDNTYLQVGEVQQQHTLSPETAAHTWTPAGD